MTLAYFQLALSMALVGGNIAVGKFIVQEVPVFLFSEIRFFIALIFLIPLLKWKGQENINYTQSNLSYLFLQAFFGVFLFSILMLYGVKLTTATSAGIITSTIPAAIGILSFVFLKEKLSMKQVVSISLAVIGILLTTFQGISTREGSTLLGNILVIGAVISEALFTIYAKKLAGVLTPLQMAVGVNFIGLLLFFPFAVNEVLRYSFSNINNVTWIMIIYYAITASVLSFILWYRGVEKVNANVAGLYTGVMPIAATIVSGVFLDEYFGFKHLLGMICVLGAIYLGTKESIKQKKHDTAKSSCQECNLGS